LSEAFYDPSRSWAAALKRAIAIAVPTANDAGKNSKS
jgi:hypothetical protein